MPITDTSNNIARRGFASMHPDRRKEVAQRGGKSAHAQGKAHKWTSEEAQEAGRKGGSVSRRRKQTEV